MTTRGAVAPREVVLGVPLLLNAGEGRAAAGCPTETPGASMDMDRDPAKMAAERAAKFIIRVRRRIQ